MKSMFLVSAGLDVYARNTRGSKEVLDKIDVFMCFKDVLDNLNDSDILDYHFLRMLGSALDS